MLSPKQIATCLQKFGYLHYVGVPCSYQTGLINYVISNFDYLNTTNEGDAIAYAAGLSLGGKKAVVLMQNSGLSNALSPLSSLTEVFKCPTLMIISWRGDPEFTDEPQHQITGTAFMQWLSTLGIPSLVLTENNELLESQVTHADHILESGSSFAFIVKKNSIESSVLQEKLPTSIENQLPIELSEYPIPKNRPNRLEVLQTLDQNLPERRALFATTGFTGRELDHLKAKGRFSMVGSMGCVGSLALGFTQAKPDIPTFVIDGDGALMMRMGALVSIAHKAPKHYFHILLDNNSYESTGHQTTLSKNVNWTQLAKACGFKKAFEVHSLEQLKNLIQVWRQSPSCVFVSIKIRTGTLSPLPRPKGTPLDWKKRFIQETHFDD